MDIRKAFRISHVFIVVLLVATSLAASSKGDYTIHVTLGAITVRLTGDFNQGVPSSLPNTTYRSFGTIPAFSGTLVGANATILSNLLKKAIEAKTSSARVTDLSFSASSNTTQMHYDTQFTVQNISTTSVYVEKVNLGWRSFAIGDDFAMAGTSINKVFGTYLAQTLIGLANQKSSPITQITTRLILNGQFVPITDIAARSQTISLFDFTSLSLPLSQWHRFDNLPGREMTFQSTAGFNLTLAQTFTEAGESATLDFNAINKLNVSITAPFSTAVSKDAIAFETPASLGIYELMVAIPFASLGLFIFSIVWERNVRKQTYAGKRRRG